MNPALQVLNGTDTGQITFSDWARAVGADSRRLRRIIIEITPDGAEVFTHQSAAPVADPLFALVHGMTTEQMSGGLAERLHPAEGADDSIKHINALVDKYDPSDSQPGETLIHRIGRVLEFYRGSLSDRRFEEEDDG